MLLSLTSDEAGCSIFALIEFYDGKSDYQYTPLLSTGSQRSCPFSPSIIIYRLFCGYCKCLDRRGSPDPADDGPKVSSLGRKHASPLGEGPGVRSFPPADIATEGLLAISSVETSHVSERGRRSDCSVPAGCMPDTRAAETCQVYFRIVHMEVLKSMQAALQ